MVFGGLRRWLFRDTSAYLVGTFCGTWKTVTSPTSRWVYTPSGCLAEKERISFDRCSSVAVLADDESEDAWETKGGTIRASLGSTTSEASAASTATTNSPPRSASRSHMRTVSESGSEHELGSRASLVYDVDENFVENTRRAEERHRQEMRSWRSALARQDVFDAPDRSYLYEIRALATRQY